MPTIPLSDHQYPMALQTSKIESTTLVTKANYSETASLNPPPPHYDLAILKASIQCNWDFINTPTNDATVNDYNATPTILSTNHQHTTALQTTKIESTTLVTKANYPETTTLTPPPPQYNLAVLKASIQCNWDFIGTPTNDATANNDAKPMTPSNDPQTTCIHSNPHHNCLIPPA